MESIVIKWYLICGILIPNIGMIFHILNKRAEIDSTIYNITTIFQGLIYFILSIFYNEIVYYILGIYFLFIKYPELPWWVGVILLYIMFTLKQGSKESVQEGFVLDYEILLSNTIYNVVTIALISYGIPYLDNLFK